MAFRDCTAITSITVPSNLQTIGSIAFGGCNNLSSLTFENINSLYRTVSVTDWQNKTNGISTSLTTSEENAINFKHNLLLIIGINSLYKGLSEEIPLKIIRGINPHIFSFMQNLLSVIPQC